MTPWVVVLLVLALIAGILTFRMGAPVELLAHNIMLFLIPLGMLIRIRVKTKQGEKEKLQQKVDELTAQLKSLQSPDEEPK